MDLKIVQKKDNPLLSRVEIGAEIDFFKEPTPKKEDIKKKIASVEKTSENLVVIKKINSSFGIGKSDVLAYIYKSEDKLKRIEPKKKEKETKKTEEATSKEESKEEQKEEGASKESKEAPKEGATKE